jgi:hypothetical protein
MPAQAQAQGLDSDKQGKPIRSLSVDEQLKLIIELRGTKYDLVLTRTRYPILYSKQFTAVVTRQDANQTLCTVHAGFCIAPYAVGAGKMIIFKLHPGAATKREVHAFQLGLLQWLYDCLAPDNPYKSDKSDKPDKYIAVTALSVRWFDLPNELVSNTFKSALRCGKSANDAFGQTWLGKFVSSQGFRTVIDIHEHPDGFFSDVSAPSILVNLRA